MPLPFLLPSTLPGEDTDPRIDSLLAFFSEHEEHGISRIISFYRENESTREFFRPYLKQIQDLENAIWDLYSQRNLVLAEGDLLDLLGGLVGEPRLGRTDSNYRRFIGVRVLSNRSDGKIEQIYDALRLIFGGSFSGYMIENFPGSMILHLFEPLTADTPARDIDLVLGRMRAAGVRLWAVYTYSPLSGTLVADSTVAPFTTLGQFPGSILSSSGGVASSVHRP